MAILQYLAIHADNIVTRETLFDQFWPNQVVTADALNRAMSNIRRALGDSSNNPQYVATIRNQGYKLVAPVTVLADPRVNQHQRLVKNMAQKAAQKTAQKAAQTALPTPSKIQLPKLMTAMSLIVVSVVFALLFTFDLLPTQAHSTTASHLQRITYDQAQNIMPTLSPDGETMAYIAKNQGQPNQLMRFKNEQTGAINLGDKSSHYSYPVFGHDDHALAVISEKAGQHKLVIFTLNKHHQIDLLTLKRPGAGLSWHPKQNLLAYSQAHPTTGKPVIFTVHSQLNQPRVITDAGSGINDQHPQFSPDGENIAFIRQFGQAQQALFVTDLQGNSRQISDDYSRILSYVWLTADDLLLSLDSGLIKLSLSGQITELTVERNGANIKPEFMVYHHPTQRLVFSQTTNSAQIATYALSGDGTKTSHLLTQSQTRDTQGTISQNGANLAFVSNRSGQFQIWLRRGNRLYPLKSTKADRIYDLRWSPNSKMLAAIGKTADEYFLLICHFDNNTVVKQSLNQQPANLIDWQNNKVLFFSQKQLSRWQLRQYDLNKKQTAQLTDLDVYQARLTPDKRRLAFINSQTTDIWLYDWQGNPNLLANAQQLNLRRNWFVDNQFLYYLKPINDLSQSQLWGIDLNNRQQKQLAQLPALDLTSRPQKLIYNFTASQHSQLDGDIWSVDIGL